MGKTTCKTKSEYRILVSFLPAFQKGRTSFNFYSDWRLTSARALSKLIDNIIHNKCKDRFSRAIVYNNYSNEAIKAYLPGYGEVSYDDYKLLHYQANQNAPEAILKAYIIFKQEIAYQYIEQGKKGTTTISNLPSALNELAALESLIQLLINSTHRNTFKKALIYWQLTNRVVVELNSLGIITYVDPEFKELLFKQSKDKSYASLIKRLTTLATPK